MNRIYKLKGLSSESVNGLMYYKIIYETPDNIYDVDNDRKYRFIVGKEILNVLNPRELETVVGENKNNMISSRVRLTLDMKKLNWVAVFYLRDYVKVPIEIVVKSSIDELFLDWFNFTWVRKMFTKKFD